MSGTNRVRTRHAANKLLVVFSLPVRYQYFLQFKIKTNAQLPTWFFTKHPKKQKKAIKSMALMRSRRGGGRQSKASTVSRHQEEVVAIVGGGGGRRR
jgi:hypothetical protein